MGAAEREGLLDRRANSGRLDPTCGRDERDVGEVLHPRVWARARHRVGVELLGDVGLDRIHAQRWWGDARERQHVLGDHELELAEDRVAERHIDAERSAVDLAGDGALGPKAQPLVLHPVVLDVGVPVIGTDGEHHEVAKVTACRAAESVEDVVGRAHDTQVDVLGGARALEA